MRRHIKHFLEAILAGMAISLSAMAYLNEPNRVVGSLLFSFGIFVVNTQGLSACNGKACFLLDHDWDYAFDLLVVWLGNYVGCVLVALAADNTRLVTSIMPRATEVAQLKMADSSLSIFLLAVMCNYMIYVGVHNYRIIRDPVGRYIGLFFCVTVYVSYGLEQCIANMFYFAFTKNWHWNALRVVLISSLGNLCGALLIPSLRRIIAWANRVTHHEQERAAQAAFAANPAEEHATVG